MIVPIVIAIAALIVFGAMLHKRSKRADEIREVLEELGFHDARHDPHDGLDFTVTVQWPEARGIRYQSYFTKREDNSMVTVANIGCYQIAGAKMGRLGAAMKMDEIEQTVVGVKFTAQTVPRFGVYPRAIEGQVREMCDGLEKLKTDDCDLERQYTIITRERDSVLRIFTSDIRRAMTDVAKVTLEAGNHSIMLYRQATVLSAVELRRVLGLAETFQRHIAATYA